LNRFCWFDDSDFDFGFLISYLLSVGVFFVPGFDEFDFPHQDRLIFIG